MADRPVHGLRCSRPSDRMIVGSEPGFREVLKGVPFVGPTGEELDRLLASIGFPRPLWSLTNFFRRPAPGKGVPHPHEDYEEAGHNLKLELERVQPKLIVPLGREAIRYFLGDVDVDEVWGLHLLPPADVRARLPMLRPDVTIAPQVHPAAGFHSPEASNQVLVGFERLRTILRGLVRARGLHDDPIPNPDYRELRIAREFADWASRNSTALEVANDTEGYPHAPWSIQLSGEAGEGALLRTPEVIAAYAAWARDTHSVTTFHAGLHDARMNRVMGLDVFDPECPIPIEDTMLMAYELGVIPQGLKALAVRELAMPMLSYQEVLGDAQERHARDYLRKLWESLNGEYQALRAEDFDFQVRVAKRRIKKLPKLPKSNLLKATERVLCDKDPYKLWQNQVIDIQVAAEIRQGDIPEASLSDVDPALALRYAARDPDATGRLRDVLLPRVREMGLEPVYRLDLATYPILDRMMAIGMQPDHAAFARLATLLDAELSVILHKLRTITSWTDFNPNSGDQTAAYVFDTLGLEVLGKRTDSGRGSTNDKVLEALEKMYPEYPQIADIRSYREYFKLRWTFVERLPDLVKRWPYDGRIHCELMLSRTPSGRLAAKSPNLLAMPKHGKFANAFRACFVPRDGCYLLSLDESQAELRVGAHLSQDPVMLAIYRGERRNPDGSMIDLHAAMGERVLGKKGHDQTKADRTAMKAINFGYWMGQTAIGLCLELRKGGLSVDEDDAQRWIDEANALYVGAVTYKARLVAEAEQHGYIRCPMSGRIRYVGGIRSRDARVRAEAERFAYSTPIQEGAQVLGKYAMAAAWKDVYVPERKLGHHVEPLLWIHDDLLSEVDTRYVFDVAKRLQRIMTTPPPGFSVPLETQPEAGLTWADMVEI